MAGGFVGRLVDELVGRSVKHSVDCLGWVSEWVGTREHPCPERAPAQIVQIHSVWGTFHP
eukprot:13679573-Heterocapsa_arctica.AAC.1